MVLIPLFLSRPVALQRAAAARPQQPLLLVVLIPLFLDLLLRRPLAHTAQQPSRRLLLRWLVSSCLAAMNRPFSDAPALSSLSLTLDQLEKWGLEMGGILQNIILIIIITFIPLWVASNTSSLIC